MANDNITTIEELRELVRIADALEEVIAKLGNTSIDGFTVSDVNGEPIAEYRFVSDIGSYTFVFAGQEYSDDQA